MKNLFILLFGLFLSFTGSSQSCLPQGITFSSQSEINNFQINYPNCTQIEGLVQIIGSDITNLNGLNVLTSVGGGLFIKSCHNLSSLTGLHNITSIGMLLYLYDNESLTSLTGLDNLTSVMDIQICWCSSLTSLTGLGSLSSFTGNFYITNNPALTSLTGLNSLTHIGGSLTIWSCGHLTSLAGLESLTIIGSSGGNLDLYTNDSLIDLTGLNNVTSIGVLLINSNPAITSLTGLNNVTFIGGATISSNNSLTSLMGLNNVTSSMINLIISSNNSLTNLEGLDSLEPNSIVSLDITNNPLLSTCAVQSICDYLANGNGTTHIYGNATGCNSIEEVKDACGITSVENLTTPESFFTGYPNPAYTIITIETQVISAKSQFTVLNVNGQQLITRQITEPKTQLDISNLPSGVYFMRLTSGKSVEVAKFVKQ
jgi:hypothetical protein